MARVKFYPKRLTIVFYIQFLQKKILKLHKESPVDRYFHIFGNIDISYTYS